MLPQLGRLTVLPSIRRATFYADKTRNVDNVTSPFYVVAENKYKKNCDGENI